MQGLARQFNLSESTFVSVADPGGGIADVRLFTPTIELAFAGHPTLGTASVVGERTGRDSVVLRMPVGEIPVAHDANGWTLTAKPATVRRAGLGARDLAAILGLAPDDIAGAANWVDSGNEQLLVPLASADAVRRQAPDAAALRRHAMTRQGEAMCHTWAWTGQDVAEARFFFSQGGSVVEDPATGSAAANLGSLLAHEGRRDVLVIVHQGSDVQRPSVLRIGVDAEGVVTVGGLVHEIGSGTVELSLQG
jgi:PhzF family phenazine biosynthesis protein